MIFVRVCKADVYFLHLFRRTVQYLKRLLLDKSRLVHLELGTSSLFQVSGATSSVSLVREMWALDL